MSARTQVGIIGAGPAGLLLSHLLWLQGISSVVLEARDRAYLERRTRAGVLEHGTVQTLREAGVGARMDAEGMVHRGVELHFDHQRHRIDFAELVGRTITVYGQQEVVKDLIARRLADQADLRFEVSEVGLHDIDSERPWLSFNHLGEPGRLDCDIVVGADGFHGVSRDQIPGHRVFERDYPFSWLGILAQARPSSEELIYARHERGFALHSMRSPEITRQYLQVSPDTDLAEWPDERIWKELQARLAGDDTFTLNSGPILDKSITGMRSFVSTPMQHGRLFLAGDAAHIVPPTGAKGMNLAIADVRLLSYAIGAFYAANREDELRSYTETALRRVWRSTHFSWLMTSMLHVDPNDDSFGEQLALAQLAYVKSSPAMARTIAENYTGLAFEQDWRYS